jgi:carbamoyltransferase
MKGAYLGPGYNDVEIRDSLTEIGAKFRVVSESELIQETARALADGLAVGWHQGRMEFGPRALGNRSILANPSLINTQRNLNLKIKFRESFRPFAPSILRSHLEEWFEISQDSPYMLLVAQVAKEKQIQMTDSQQSLFGIDKLNIPRSSIPAVTHVDYSARIQTVHSSTNPRFHSLLERFYELTGIPILVNTSFNIRGEPIVESPKDAFKCFMGTEIDLLAIGNNLLLKSDQPLHLVSEYRSEYGRD